MIGVLCDMALSLATSSLARLSVWFETPLGRRLLNEQTPLVRDCARRFHGDTLLWVGCHTDLAETVRGCMIRNRILLSLQGAGQPAGQGITGMAELDLAEFESTLEAIPLPNSSLDAVVLHHVLETAEDPRTAIRELSRVLAPGGRLLVCGFNPYSLWGGRSVWARVKDDGFSDLRFVSPLRLLDWLAVLGFELQHEVRYLAYGMPFPTGDRDPKLWQYARAQMARYRIPVGGAYLISAVKQAAVVQPEGRNSRVAGRKLAPVAYPKISARLSKSTDRSESR